MRWPWQERRPADLVDRTNALRAGSARIAADGYVRLSARGDVAEVTRQADLDYLIAIQNDNANIRDMAQTPGWVEYEAALARLATRKLRELPRKVLNEGEKSPSVLWDAALIDIVNAVLLGTVNNALYESANLDRLINTKLAAQERLAREEQSNG